MKDILLPMATYNMWANERLSDAILLLPEEKIRQEIKSSFPSLYLTLLHMWNAESIWWQRLKLYERTERPDEYFKGTAEELVQSLLQQNRQWLEWVANANDNALHHVFAYQNTKKEQFKQPVYQMLTHVFNHGTYHRGQLVTMLRELGVEKIPSTDFIVWSRKK